MPLASIPWGEHEVVLNVARVDMRTGQEPSLNESGPDLVDGIVTVDDASFTAQAHMQSGTQERREVPCVDLPDIGSPQSPSQVEVKRTGAFTAACYRATTPRTWGDFGNSPPLQTSTAIRPRV